MSLFPEAIGEGMRVRDVEEFNRRAVIALRGADLEHGSWNWQFARDMDARVTAHKPLSERQQATLIKLVHRLRRQITDQLVLDYAAENLRETD